MNDQLSSAVIAASLALALWSLVLIVLDRPVGGWLVGGTAVLECLLLALLAVGVAATITTSRDVERVTFVGYLVGALLIPPVAVLWSLGERSRYGTAVLLVATLILPVMVLRMQQIWAGPVV